MSDTIIENFLRRAALCTGRARTCLRHGRQIEARQLTEKAALLLNLCAQARLVRACASIEAQSSN